MNKVSFEGIAEWFTGKASEKAKWAVDQINASLAEGEWIPGVSRTVKAALDKVNAKALNTAKAADKLADAQPYYHEGYVNESGAVKGLKEAYHAIYWCMKYGKQIAQPQLDLVFAHSTRVSTKEQAEIREILAAAHRCQSGRAPILDAIKHLDAQRPKPVFVMKTLSPTGAKLLLDAGYKPDSSRLPQFVYHRELNPATGKFECWTEIVWPEGTLHGKSRFYHGTQRNFQCHACGHAIKNGFNWVPLAIDNGNGEIHSFWVGRDCAKNLFGVEMKGEASYKNTEGR